MGNGEWVALLRLQGDWGIANPAAPYTYAKLQCKFSRASCQLLTASW
jgi:hypothetical protein